MLSLDPQRYSFHLLSKLFSFISISILTLYTILSEAERQIHGSEPKSRVIQRSRMKWRTGGQAGESDGPKHVAWVDKWWLCSLNRWHCSTLWTCIRCSCRDFWHKDKNVQEVSQHIVHKCLEDFPGIGKSKRNHGYSKWPNGILNTIFHSSSPLMCCGGQAWWKCLPYGEILIVELMRSRGYFNCDVI